MGAYRNTAKRNKHRLAVKARGDACWLCGRELRWDVHYLDDDYATIDHIVPLANGGLDVIDNIRGAHRKCNIKRQDRDYAPDIIRRSKSLSW